VASIFSRAKILELLAAGDIDTSLLNSSYKG
jgi:hypothetical protein